MNKEEKCQNSNRTTYWNGLPNIFIPRAFSTTKYFSGIIIEKMNYNFYKTYSFEGREWNINNEANYKHKERTQFLTDD